MVSVKGFRREEGNWKPKEKGPGEGTYQEYAQGKKKPFAIKVDKHITTLPGEIVWHSEKTDVK